MIFLEVPLVEGEQQQRIAVNAFFAGLEAANGSAHNGNQREALSRFLGALSNNRDTYKLVYSGESGRSYGTDGQLYVAELTPNKVNGELVTVSAEVVMLRPGDVAAITQSSGFAEVAGVEVDRPVFMRGIEDNPRSSLIFSDFPEAVIALSSLHQAVRS